MPSPAEQHRRDTVNQIVSILDRYAADCDESERAVRIVDLIETAGSLALAGVTVVVSARPVTMHEGLRSPHS